MMEKRLILCAVDFSQFAHEALRVGVELARERKASLLLVHVEQPPLWMHEPPVHLPGDVRPETLVAAERELVAWKREAELQGVAEVVTRLAQGAPWEQIVAIATAEPDVELVVLGTHGRTGITRALIGSVAERVVRHAPCNVMVVRKRA
jgi:universal stress protein A